MVSCVSGVCGTGTGNYPQPGDPNLNDSLLTASPAFGGIDLNWTWPTTNPQAVAYTKIWRSLQNDFNTSNRIVDAAAGSFYYDKVDLDLSLNVTYYYWIQIVSVNGTIGDTIGPASASARPLIEQVIEQMTGKIDAGLLATTLRTSIDQINLNSLGITAEEEARAANDDGLAVSVTTISAKADQALATLQEEIRARTDADGSIVQVVNTMYADFGGNIAALQQANTVLSTQVGALSQTVTTVNATVNGDSASGQVGLVATVQTVNGKVTDIGARWTAVVDVNGAVGGFGVYNNGQTIEAGFNVDTFWIGKSGSKTYPFIVSGGVAYIKEAAIQSLTFSKLRDESGSLIVSGGKVQAAYISVTNLVVNAAQSTNYIAGVQGWALSANGTVEINGTAGGGRMIITPQYIKIYDTSGIKRVQLGNLDL